MSLQRYPTSRHDRECAVCGTTFEVQMVDEGHGLSGYWPNESVTFCPTCDWDSDRPYPGDDFYDVSDPEFAEVNKHRALAGLPALTGETSNG